MYKKICPYLCPNAFLTYSDGTEGGRWCNWPSDRTPSILNNGWISPKAVVDALTLDSGTFLNGQQAVLGNVDIYRSIITGDDVIIGGPDCNTKIGYIYLTNSEIEGDGIRIYGDTRIFNCRIAGRAQITGGTLFTENNSPCYVGDDAVIGGYAQINGSQITQHAEVYGSAWLVGSTITGNAKIYGNAYVEGSEIGGDAKVCGNTKITGIHHLTTCEKRFCSDCP